MLDQLDTENQHDEDPEVREQMRMKRFGWEDEYWRGESTLWMKLKPRLWALFDEPYSSSAAKVCPISYRWIL